MSRPEDLKLRRRLREEAHAIQKDKSLQASAHAPTHGRR